MTLTPIRVIQQQVAQMTTRLDQNLRGARIVKAFAQELAETRRFEDETQKLLDLNMRAARLSALNLPLLNTIASAGLIFILLYGGQLVIDGQLTIGELVAFTTCVSQLTVPVRRLGMIRAWPKSVGQVSIPASWDGGYGKPPYNPTSFGQTRMIIAALAQAIAAGERVFEILDAQSDVTDRPDAKPLGKIDGHVRFAHVSFAYFGRHQILSDIDFEAQPGQMIALLGTTGSGKSTIANLVAWEEKV